MNQIVPTVAWMRVPEGAAPEPLDPRLLPMLAAVDAGGTLADAARAAGVAYRSAWGMVAEAERALGAPLLDLGRGRAARLSPLGRALLERHRAATAWLGRRHESLAVEVPSAEAEAGRQALRVSASHDLALAALREDWHAARIADVAFKGSVDSLGDYVRGNADLAGFHGLQTDERLVVALHERLDPARDVTIRFLVRTQGLILPRGNPRRVRSLADVARRGLRFVNRQAGSGTRIIVDALLARDGVASSRVVGYSDEEFTHGAIAATVASGGADAGFGVEAAAARQGLAFVPVAREHYLFACRRETADSARVRSFRRALASAPTRAVVAALPGYALDRPGTLARVR
jgi:molybdate transport repressor ModE-like protein